MFLTGTTFNQPPELRPQQNSAQDNRRRQVATAARVAALAQQTRLGAPPVAPSSRATHRVVASSAAPSMPPHATRLEMERFRESIEYHGRSHPEGRPQGTQGEKTGASDLSAPLPEGEPSSGGAKYV